MHAVGIVIFAPRLSLVGDSLQPVLVLLTKLDRVTDAIIVLQSSEIKHDPILRFDTVQAPSVAASVVALCATHSDNRKSSDRSTALPGHVS